MELSISRLFHVVSSLLLPFALQAGTIHGFSGYFESKLYKDVFISIYPPSFSTGREPGVVRVVEVLEIFRLPKVQGLWGH